MHNLATYVVSVELLVIEYMVEFGVIALPPNGVQSSKEKSSVGGTGLGWPNPSMIESTRPDARPVIAP